MLNTIFDITRVFATDNEDIKIIADLAKNKVRFHDLNYYDVATNDIVDMNKFDNIIILNLDDYYSNARIYSILSVIGYNKNIIGIVANKEDKAKYSNMYYFISELYSVDEIKDIPLFKSFFTAFVNEQKPEEVTSKEKTEQIKVNDKIEIETIDATNKEEIKNENESKEISGEELSEDNQDKKKSKRQKKE